jgi:hypothetical protein
VLLLDLSVSETSGFEGAALNSLRFVLVGGGSPAGSPQAAISAVKLWRDDGDDTFEPGTGDTLVQTGTVGGSNDVSYTSLGETVSVSGTVSYWLAADFNGSASSGSTFTASLANADVGAVGATTGLALPVTGGPVNARTVSVVKGALTIADGGHTPANGNVGASATNVLLLDLSVWETTGLEAASLNSLRFVLVGGGSPAGSPQAAISAVKLWRDDGDDTFEPGTGDTLVQTGTVGTGNDVSLTSLGETVAASGSVSYWMSVDFNGTASAGSTFTASLANADVGAVGATSAAALTTTGGPVNARTVTIAVVAAGTLTLSVSSGDATLPNFLRRTAAVGSANVAAALFNLAPTGEGANVSSITLTHGGLANGQTHVAAIRIWADVGSTAGAVDGTDVLLGSVSTGYGAGGTATIAVTRTINAASNENWIVAYDLTNACPYARTFTVSVAAVTDVTALGATSGNPMTIAGPSLTSGTRSLGGTWVQLNPTGTWPGIAASNYTRIYYAAAYDAQANRMIINGGADDGSSTNFTWFADTWALDLTAGSEQWNLLNAGGGTSDPPALWHHVAIYHAQSTARYFLVWGGYMNGLSANVQNTAWQMNLGANTWAQINTSTSGPAGREGAGAVWDPAGNRMLVFGGWEPGTSTMQADVWALSLGASPAWTQLLTSSATGAPSGRYMCTCVLDTSTSPARMIVHGGDNISGQTLSDAYALTLSATPTWSTLSTAAQVRSFHPSAIDSTANQVIVFGGWDGNGWVNLNDTEALDLARGAPAGTWGYHLTSGTAPSTREENRGVWDTVSNRFIIYGGWRGGSPIFTGTPDVWSFR